jgi:PGDYG protein
MTLLLAKHVGATPSFHCAHGDGYLQEISNNPNCIVVRARAREVSVTFATVEDLIDTIEGQVLAHVGDAVVTGVLGERWPIDRARFHQKYAPVAPTRCGRCGTYRRRQTLAHALRQDHAFFVHLAAGHSRLTGTSGDWLVDYGDGTLGIVAAAVFERSYELICRSACALPP